MSKKRHPRIGSSLDSFLKAEGILEELQEQAVKEVVAWQLEEEMKKKRVSKAGLAKMLRTSRTQVNRLLDPASDVTVSSLQRAAALVGWRLRLELVWSRGGAGGTVGCQVRPAFQPNVNA